jgi:hypothetical protein
MGAYGGSAPGAAPGWVPQPKATPRKPTREGAADDLLGAGGVARLGVKGGAAGEGCKWGRKGEGPVGSSRLQAGRGGDGRAGGRAGAGGGEGASPRQGTPGCAAAAFPEATLPFPPSHTAATPPPPPPSPLSAPVVGCHRVAGHVAPGVVGGSGLGLPAGRRGRVGQGGAVGHHKETQRPTVKGWRHSRWECRRRSWRQ